MTHTDFVNWLRGFMAGRAGAHPTPDQYKMIQDNLESCQKDSIKLGHGIADLHGIKGLSPEAQEVYMLELEKASKWKRL